MRRKSVGVKVPKIDGEKTIRLANKLKLFDRKFKVRSDGDFVYIPLAHKPSEDELEELQSQVAVADVSTYLFSERAKQAGTLVDLLDGMLAPDLTAALPRSADVVGNIAIVEVPPKLEAYQAVIGEAVLKLNKNVKTVLAKAGAISGTYRLREFKVIAGEPNMATIHKEYGCRYYVDLAEAYFSSRLSYEHHRVASLVREGETVVDLFAGVGPFAIQIAKTHENVRVYAVDVNPRAIEFLRKNVRLNRMENRVFPVLGDAGDVVEEKLSGIADRVIMNLPERATEFVCASCKTLKPAGGIIHFYSFVKASDSLKDAQTGFEEAAERCGRKVGKILFSRLVRATAPYEWQSVLDAQVV